MVTHLWPPAVVTSLRPSRNMTTQCEWLAVRGLREPLAGDWRLMAAFSKLRAVYGKWAWLAGQWLAVDGGVLNITVAAWTASFHWWRSGNITRTQNVSQYMLVCLVCWFWRYVHHLVVYIICFPTCPYFFTLSLLIYSLTYLFFRWPNLVFSCLSLCHFVFLMHGYLCCVKLGLFYIFLWLFFVVFDFLVFDFSEYWI